MAMVRSVHLPAKSRIGLTHGGTRGRAPIGGDRRACGSRPSAADGVMRPIPSCTMG